MTHKKSWQRPHDVKKFANGWELAYGSKDKPVKYVPVRKLKKERAA